MVFGPKKIFALPRIDCLDGADWWEARNLSVSAIGTHEDGNGNRLLSLTVFPVNMCVGNLELSPALQHSRAGAEIDGLISSKGD